MKEIRKNNYSPDVLELMALLYKNKVEYLIVGGQAVIYYGHVRLTGDIDFLYNQTEKNVDKLYITLLEFWNNDIPGLHDKNELMEKNVIFQFGAVPNRIDLISKIEAVNFKGAWQKREIVKINTGNEILEVYFIDAENLIKNKETLKREKDLDDLKYLKQIKLK
ncbi:MAG: DUF6036 family nucleotidyltransferase [Candidatus Cloacimonadota bacterium]|nr:DUF6036 family nucleotidyltransferase [Candidatus Cloacimonadota bacterium]